MCSVVGYH